MTPSEPDACHDTHHLLRDTRQQRVATAVVKGDTRYTSSSGGPVALRWSREHKGWIAFRDPETGVWDAVWHRDMPAWRQILLANIGAHQRRRDQPSADPLEAHCCGAADHEPCEFGLGLACLKGDDCRNPHHDPRPWPMTISPKENVHD
jgi:hypothetical protein